MWSKVSKGRVKIQMFWDRCHSSGSRKDIQWILLWCSWKQISRKLNFKLMLWMSSVSVSILLYSSKQSMPFFSLFSYTCTFLDQHLHDKFYMWNVSVSDHCCQHCDGVVYKADSVIETVFHQDKCETVETSICRILPGALSFQTMKEGSLN